MLVLDYAIVCIKQDPQLNELIRMQRNNVNYQPVMDQPATYQIEVQGRLSQRWAAMFGNLTITSKDEVNGPPITILRGTVVDQAALHGLLNHIGELGLPLLSVKRIGTA